MENNSKNSKSPSGKWSKIIRVGWFLAIRQIKGSNKSTTFLIVFIMMLTFLNMVVVSGILVGLIEGGSIANKKQYSGDVLSTTLAGNNNIGHTNEIESTLRRMDGVGDISTRYISGGQIEANYKTRRDFSELKDIAGTQITGISVKDEDALSGISKFVTEGKFLNDSESGYIVIGKNLLHRYSEAFGDVFASLEGTYPGDEVKVTVGENTKTFIVKGIVSSKVNEVSLRAFITRQDFLRLVDKADLNANEIAVRIEPASKITAEEIKANLVKAGFTPDAKIQTATEAVPEFLNQIRVAFSLLGNIIGLIGIVVASITIFIVIFINAVTRRKYIGIMKGIGISEKAIEFSYIIQSIFYALIGGLIGMLIAYILLVPFFNTYPLNFPFSDGILVAPVNETVFKFFLLMLVTLIAGYIPARNIVKKNTLDSILGR
ncbi:MAG TPA: FtsX-like permease family protein [Candidatus Paceibacterota bacterium]|jgi:putative ABC transport system permease protein|nr:FtsX-like permease family protein [Candidatus Paceibacterota bacterium]